MGPTVRQQLGANGTYCATTSGDKWDLLYDNIWGQMGPTLRHHHGTAYKDKYCWILRVIYLVRTHQKREGIKPMRTLHIKSATFTIQMRTRRGGQKHSFSAYVLNGQIMKI